MIDLAKRLVSRSAAAADALTFAGGGHVRPLSIRRSARARRMRLAVDPRDGTVRLTLPPRAALMPALSWAESQRGWIEAALARLPHEVPIAPGTTIPFEGKPLRIEWCGKSGRIVRCEGDRLIVGGPQEMVGRRVLRWLRAEAARLLTADTRRIADAAGVTFGRIRIGDPRSRWGSCSGRGDIAYSWRLVLMPPTVREAIVAHELAHRLHMHHGPEFHAALARLLGRVPTAENAWLKRHGAALYRVGR